MPTTEPATHRVGDVSGRAEGARCHTGYIPKALDVTSATFYGGGWHIDGYWKGVDVPSTTFRRPLVFGECLDVELDVGAEPLAAPLLERGVLVWRPGGWWWGSSSTATTYPSSICSGTETKSACGSRCGWDRRWPISHNYIHARCASL